MYKNGIHKTWELFDIADYHRKEDFPHVRQIMALQHGSKDHQHRHRSKRKQKVSTADDPFLSPAHSEVSVCQAIYSLFGLYVFFW